MNDPKNPANDDGIGPQKDNFQLKEGQEVSLDLPEPAPTPSPPPNDKLPNSSGPDDLVVSQESTIQSAPPQLTTKPMINLSPSKVVVDSARYKLSDPQQKALTKLNKIRKHKHWYNIKLVIGTVLVFLLIFYSQFFISQFIYLFNKPSSNNQNNTNQTQPATPSNPVGPTPAPTQPQPEVVGPQNEIIIPKIGITAPLVFIDTNNEIDVLRALRDGVVHYYGTAYPGEVGNSVFFGHSSNDWWEPGNYKFVFVLLEKLVPGDTYDIHYNSRKYTYTVTETKVVAPTDLSVLNQTSEPTSTLITCTPPGTSWRRFIVFAKQTSPAPSTTPQQPAQQTQQQANSQSGTAVLPSAPPTIWDQIVIFFRKLFGGSEQTTDDKTDQSPSTQQHLPEVN